MKEASTGGGSTVGVVGVLSWALWLAGVRRYEVDGEVTVGKDRARLREEEEYWKGGTSLGEGKGSTSGVGGTGENGDRNAGWGPSSGRSSVTMCGV